jgi:oxalate decarboxylase
LLYLSSLALSPSTAANRRIWLVEFKPEITPLPIPTNFAPLPPGGLAASQSLAAGNDGHALGYDVAPASDHMALVPRRTGDPVTFSTSLDKSPIKATSGGWARDITSKSLPVATSIAGAHLYLNPGGVREMHWHNSAEWAYILTGHCQVTVVDPQGETEVANYAAGDLWYFPKAHAHAIQT